MPIVDLSGLAIHVGPFVNGVVVKTSPWRHRACIHAQLECRTDIAMSPAGWYPARVARSLVRVVRCRCWCGCNAAELGLAAEPRPSASSPIHRRGCCGNSPFRAVVADQIRRQSAVHLLRHDSSRRRRIVPPDTELTELAASRTSFVGTSRCRYQLASSVA